MTKTPQALEKTKNFQQLPLALYATTLNDRFMLDQFVGNIGLVTVSCRSLES